MGSRLAGKTAWISGGASGIGAAVTRLFAAEGANVFVADVLADQGKTLAESIGREGGNARFQLTDVSRENDVRQSIDLAAKQFGGLQIIVNCAGIVHVGLLHEYDESDWDRLMGVNVKGIYFSIKHALPHLRKQASSHMVNVGSISSFVGQASTPAYTASKAAVLGLSRSIALDYASIGLRCNCVCPGITDTPMLRTHLNATPDPEATLRQRVRRVPLNRAMASDDIARAVLYLSCDDSSGVTGTSLVVDGGYLAAAEWDAG